MNDKLIDFLKAKNIPFMDLKTEDGGIAIDLDDIPEEHYAETMKLMENSGTKTDNNGK